MGLLNDAKNRKMLSALIADHHRKIIFTSYFAGVVWFLALSSDHLNNKTYFSENALLPGLVVREFNPGWSLNRLLGILEEEISAHSSMPYSWIQAQFKQIGLDVYVQNFSLHYPFGSKPRHEGKNIYAVLRSTKACSTESLVLSTPFRGRDSIHEPTLPSVVLMIELAQYFRRHRYWSKDVIFLITEYEMIGLQAWLNAYYDSSMSDFIESEPLMSRSGLIQGVVNLEISHEQLSYIDIKIEGLNGQLPNLDLFNLAVELCTREMVLPVFQSHKPYSPSFSFESWKNNLQTMLSMMGMQAMGLPTGGHGLFHRFGVQAITLASRVGETRNSKVTMVQAGRVLEGIFRSLNNLLEKFHQSFFFYLLPSTRRYISIGLYMTPFALIAAPVLIKALYLYNECTLSIQKKQDFLIRRYFSLWSALDILVVGHSLGLLVYFSPTFVDSIQSHINFSTEDALYYLHTALLFTAMMFLFFYYRATVLYPRHYLVKLCVVLLELGAFLYTLALINISLATFLSLFYVPVSILLGCKGRLVKLHHILLFLINPYTLTFLIVLIQSCITHADVNWYQHLFYSIEGHKKVILYTIEDMYFFSNWNYKIVTLALLPLWFQLWSLASMKVDCDT